MQNYSSYNPNSNALCNQLSDINCPNANSEVGQKAVKAGYEEVQKALKDGIKFFNPDLSINYCALGEVVGNAGKKVCTTGIVETVKPFLLPASIAVLGISIFMAKKFDIVKQRK